MQWHSSFGLSSGGYTIGKTIERCPIAHCVFEYPDNLTLLWQNLASVEDGDEYSWGTTLQWNSGNNIKITVKLNAVQERDIIGLMRPHHPCLSIRCGQIAR